MGGSCPPEVGGSSTFSPRTGDCEQRQGEHRVSNLCALRFSGPRGGAPLPGIPVVPAHSYVLGCSDQERKREARGLGAVLEGPRPGLGLTLGDSRGGCAGPLGTPRPRPPGCAQVPAGLSRTTAWSVLIAGLGPQEMSSRCSWAHIRGVTRCVSLGVWLIPHGPSVS